MDVTTQSVLARVRAALKRLDERYGIGESHTAQLLADVDMEIVRLSTRKDISND